MSIKIFIVAFLILFLIAIGINDLCKHFLNKGFEQGRRFDPRTSQDRFNEILLDSMETKGMLTGAKYKDAMEEAEKLSGWRVR